MKHIIKGAGQGSEVDFHFFVVSDRGECQLSETFFELKNIVPSLETWKLCSRNRNNNSM